MKEKDGFQGKKALEKKGGSGGGREESGRRGDGIGDGAANQNRPDKGFDLMVLFPCPIFFVCPSSCFPICLSVCLPVSMSASQ